jgi:hypothetical protein
MIMYLVIYIISLGILQEAKNLSNNNQKRTKPPDKYDTIYFDFSIHQKS